MHKKSNNARQNTTRKTDERKCFGNVSYIRFVELGFDKDLGYGKALAMVRVKIRVWAVVA